MTSSQEDTVDLPTEADGSSSPQFQRALTVKQFCLNWLSVMMIAVNNVSGYVMSLSTLHNFITNPQNGSCDNPGFGEPETTYAVAAGMYYGGIMVGALIFPIFYSRLDYRRLLTIGPLIQTAGCLLYALSTAAWMVILARLLIGVNYGMAIPAAMSYFTSSAREYYINCKSSNRESRINRLKKRLMITLGIVNSTAYIPFSVLVSLVVRFSSVNPFRWIGWCQAGISSFTVLLLLYVFTNGTSASSDKKSATKKLSFKAIRSIKSITVMTVGYLILTGYIVESSISVLDTMTSQVLSDYFGFSVQYITYFYIGVIVIAPLSTITLLVAQKFSISSHFLLLLSLLLGTTGLLAMGDWQGILPDECSHLSNVSIATSYRHSACSSETMPSCALVSNGTISKCPLLDSDKGTVVFRYYREMVPSNDHSTCPQCTGYCHYYLLSGDTICNLFNEETYAANSNFEYYHYDPNTNTSLCLARDAIPLAYSIETCKVSTLTDLLAAMNEISDEIVSDDQKSCESADSCYWNPSSIITGEYCPECLSVCRSRSGSLSFPQVCIGVTLASVSVPMGHYILYPIVSKVAPPNIEELATSILVLMQAFAGLITPIWTTKLYVFSGRQTFISIAVMLSCQIPVYIGFCIFYKQMTTKKEVKVVKKIHRPSTASITPLFDVQSLESPVDEVITVDSLSSNTELSQPAATAVEIKIVLVNDQKPSPSVLYETPL